MGTPPRPLHHAPTDPHAAGERPARTRGWIIAAFNRLVLGRGYDALRVGEVSRTAGVGRSTFYEHFRDKDELLRASLAPILRPLADAAIGKGDVERVRFVLDHIAENAPRALAMLDGPTRSHFERALADMILERHAGASENAPAPLHRMDALRLAGGHVAMILAWLRAPTPTSLAPALTSAEVAALLVERPLAPIPPAP